MASTRKKKWKAENDKRLLELIEQKANYMQLELAFGVSKELIRQRILGMGFEGLKDAQRVMRGE